MALWRVSMAGRGVTGRGADLIIIDDPIAVKDAGNAPKLEQAMHYTDSELRPRFDHPSREKILYVAIDWPKRTFRPTSMIKAIGNALHCRW